MKSTYVTDNGEPYQVIDGYHDFDVFQDSDIYGDNAIRAIITYDDNEKTWEKPHYIRLDRAVEVPVNEIPPDMMAFVDEYRRKLIVEYTP